MNDSSLDYHDFPADTETLNSLDTSDANSVDIEKVPRETARAALKPAPSLKPGPAMMESAAMGNKEACAIRDMWKFSFPVRTVGREEFAEMTSRNQVVFHE